MLTVISRLLVKQENRPRFDFAIRCRKLFEQSFSLNIGHVGVGQAIDLFHLAFKEGGNEYDAVGGLAIKLHHERHSHFYPDVPPAIDRILAEAKFFERAQADNYL